MQNYANISLFDSNIHIRSSIASLSLWRYFTAKHICNVLSLASLSWQSGPSAVMVLSSEDAVMGWRALMGPVDPEEAKTMAPDRCVFSGGVCPPVCSPVPPCIPHQQHQGSLRRRRNKECSSWEFQSGTCKEIHCHAIRRGRPGSSQR